MNDSTTYSVAGLQEGIGNLSRAHKDLTTLLDDLKGELASSLGSWEDNARHSYQEVQVQWDQSAQRQKDIVQRMPVLLNNIADGYDSTEKRNAGIWS